MNLIITPQISTLGSSYIQPVSTRTRVLIKSGQSNHRGQQLKSKIAVKYPYLVNGPIPGVQIFNGSTYESIEADVNTNWPSPNTRIGSELNYSYLINNFWGGTDYVIKWGVGATKIEEWLPGGLYHDAFYAFVAAGLAAISSDSNDYSVILDWDHGESNAVTSFEYAQTYGSLFSEFIEEMRSTLNVRSLPVIQRKMRLDGIAVFPYLEDIRDQQYWIMNNIDNVQMVSGDDLTLFDNIHFDGISQCILGKRKAELALYLYD